MKMSEVIKKCVDAIPRSVEYTEGEEYGPFNITNLDTEVKNILYCVTPTKEVEDCFRKCKYDLLISHHPIVTSPDIPQLIFHTALDCCEGGLNDMWAKAVGLDPNKKQHFDKDLGWFGPLVDPIPFDWLLRKVRLFAGSVDGQIFHKGGDLVKTVAVCSGLGGLVTKKALTTGVDCYIIGEAVGPAEKMGFNSVIEIGHTNSEWQGLKFFDQLLKGCNIEVDYIRHADYFGTEYFGGNYR